MICKVQGRVQENIYDIIKNIEWCERRSAPPSKRIQLKIGHVVVAKINPTPRWKNDHEYQSRLSPQWKNLPMFLVHFVLFTRFSYFDVGFSCWSYSFRYLNFRQLRTASRCSTVHRTALPASRRPVSFGVAPTPITWLCNFVSLPLDEWVSFLNEMIWIFVLSTI